MASPRNVRPPETEDLPHGGASTGFNFEEPTMEEPGKDMVALQEVMESSEMNEGTVRINRKRPPAPGDFLLETVSARAFSLEYVARQWGGGEYRCQLVKANGKIWKQFRFAVDASIRGLNDEPKEKPAGNGDLLAAVLSRPQDNNVALLMQIMSENNKLAMAMMQQQTQVMVATVQAVAAGGRRDPASDFTPVICEVLKRQQPDVMGQMSQMAGLLRDLRDGGEDLPAPEKSGILDKVIEMGLPLLGALLASKGLAAPPAPAQINPPDFPPAEPPAESPAAAEPQPQPQPPPKVFDALIIRKAQKWIADKLLAAAAQKKDIGLYADMIDELVPESIRPLIVEQLKQPNWIELAFGERANEARVHLEWLNTLRDEILKGPPGPDAEPPDLTHPA